MPVRRQGQRHFQVSAYWKAIVGWVHENIGHWSGDQLICTLLHWSVREECNFHKLSQHVHLVHMRGSAMLVGGGGLFFLERILCGCVSCVKKSFFVLCGCMAVVNKSFFVFCGLHIVEICVQTSVDWVMLG